MPQYISNDPNFGSSNYISTDPNFGRPDFSIQAEIPQLPTLPSFKPSPIPPPILPPLASLSFDPLRRILGQNIGNFGAGFLSGPFSSEETWASPYGKVGAIAGSLTGIGGLYKGGKALIGALRKARTVVPKVEILPPEVTPGFKRLAGLEEPRGFLGAAENPPIIPPFVESKPTRFIQGRQGTVEAGRNYPIYPTGVNAPAEVAANYPSGPVIDQPTIRGLLPESPLVSGQGGTGIPGTPYTSFLNERVPIDVAASYGTEIPSVPAMRSLKWGEKYQEIYQTLVNRGEDPIKADAIATSVTNKIFPPPPVQRIKLGEEIPVTRPAPDYYSGPMTAEGGAIPGKVEVLPPEIPPPQLPVGQWPAVSGMKQGRPIKIERPFVSEYPKIGRSISITNPTQKKAKEVLKSIKKGTPIEQAVKNEELDIPNKIIPERTLKSGVFSSQENELHKMGPAGDEINVLQGRASMYARQRAASWDEMVNKIPRGKDEEFFDLMDSGGNSPNPKMQKALNEAREMDRRRMELWTSTGIRNPETGELSTPLGNYAPRIYPEGFWEDPKNVVSALIKKYPNMPPSLAEEIAQGRSSENIVDRVMRSAGVSRDTAEKILRLGKLRAERKISSQYARELDLPGYRKDREVWKEHNWDVARKVSEQEVFGRLDTADPNSSLSKLIEQTPNPQYAKDLVNTQLGRKWGYSSDLKTFSKLDRAANALSSGLYLGWYRLSNLGNFNPIVLETSLKSTAKALYDTIAHPSAARHIANTSGATYNISKSMAEAAVNSGWLGKAASKINGIESSENFMRTISAGAGRAYSRDLFVGLKKGTLSPAEIKQLSSITDTPIETLAKQVDLTEQQLRNAGFKVTEVSQGLSEPRKLPEFWNNPYLKTIFIFKRFAFQQTRAYKNAILRDPKNLAVLLGTSLATGEVIGNSKAAIRGVIRGTAEGNIGKGIDEELKRRTKGTERILPDVLTKDKSLESQLIIRAIDDLNQAWFLGLFADLLYSSTNREGIFSTLVGPFYSTAVEAADMARRGVKTGWNWATGEEEKVKRQMETLSKELVGKVPVVGYPIQRAIWPPKEE